MFHCYEKERNKYFCANAFSSFLNRGRESDYQGLPSFDYILAADCIYKEKQVNTQTKKKYTKSIISLILT